MTDHRQDGRPARRPRRPVGEDRIAVTTEIDAIWLRQGTGRLRQGTGSPIPILREQFMAYDDYDDNNIFAKVLRGEIPCHKIYEDDHTFAFLDIMPRSPGHALVITKARAENILDIAEEDLAHVLAAVRRLAPRITQAVGAEGFMIQQFNGAAAGQTVFHLHIHIVPRSAGVPLKRHASEAADTADLAALAEKIRAALATEA